MKLPLSLGLLLVLNTACQAQTPETAPEPGPPPPSEEVVVEVNGEPVLASDLEMAMRGMESQMAQQGVPVDQVQLRELATRQAVDTLLLVQEAARRELVAGDDRVEEAMARIVTQAGGSETLAANLEEAGFTLATLRRSVAMAETIRRLIDESIRPEVEVTAEQVAEVYAANEASFRTPDQVRARHILRTVDPDGGDEALAAARSSAEEARDRALAGEPFDELARELSQGPTGPRGGELGFFSADQMVPAFAEAAFALGEGEISDVVTTQFGFHVIKLEEKRPAGTRTLAEVEGQLRASLEEQGVGQALETLLETLRVGAEVQPKAGATEPPTEAPS